MRQIKRWFLQDENHKDCNTFSLTVICRGNEKGHLLDRHGKKAWETELLLMDSSDVETLKNKPKLVMISVLLVQTGNSYRDG